MVIKKTKQKMESTSRIGSEKSKPDGGVGRAVAETTDAETGRRSAEPTVAQGGEVSGLAVDSNRGRLMRGGPHGGW
ncbi:hypothetical protein HanRHA438_Chr09g0387881 [Helianthus annuus]|nr:hypothetical protein HanRHA438_Chr09g0387881 [Helianthus annuus]